MGPNPDMDIPEYPPPVTETTSSLPPPSAEGELSLPPELASLVANMARQVTQGEEPDSTSSSLQDFLSQFTVSIRFTYSFVLYSLSVRLY